jgi:adenine phosphoribosyltransferase
MSQILKDAIRIVPDFPQKGIMFKDISPILQDSKLFRLACDELIATAQGAKIDKVVGIDARGFIFGAAVAMGLNVGFVPVRKKGKLPWKTIGTEYALEYGTNSVEMHLDAVKPGEHVMLVDDLLATGGTAAAAVKLLNQLGAELVCVSFLVELSFLKGREKINSSNIHSIITY